MADKTNNENLPKPFFKVIRKSLYCNVIIESFRFKDEDDYEYKIHSSFLAYSQKTEIPESLIVLFFTQKVSEVVS